MGAAWGADRQLRKKGHRWRTSQWHRAWKGTMWKAFTPWGKWADRCHPYCGSCDVRHVARSVRSWPSAARGAWLVLPDLS
eukprot:6468359-Alexandrium_andersonii.AAC.1